MKDTLSTEALRVSKPPALCSYSYPPCPEAAWLEATELAILNTAIIPEGGYIFASSPPQAVLNRALGLGYRYRNGEPEGLIVLLYPTAEHARTDLPVRAHMAKEGVSLQVKGPYAEAVFHFGVEPC